MLGWMPHEVSPENPSKEAPRKPGLLLAGANDKPYFEDQKEKSAVDCQARENS